MFGNTYLNDSDFVKICLAINNEMCLIKDKCKLVLEMNPVNINEEIMDNILKKTYISKKYLKRR